jgi:hypothetical protein
MSPNARGPDGGVTGSQPMSTAVYMSPNKLWRSNSIFNLCMGPCRMYFKVVVGGGWSTMRRALIPKISHLSLRQPEEKSAHQTEKSEKADNYVWRATIPSCIF